MAEAFDTLAASEELQTAGLDEKQSKAVARVINGAIIGNVATKRDIENLRATTKSDIETAVISSVCAGGTWTFSDDGWDEQCGL